MISFAPLDPVAPVFFGFGEYLASLALMVLAWTIGDNRYRFRISSAPLPMSKLTFGAVAVVGVLTLLTDVGRAQAWPLPVVGPRILPPGAVVVLARRIDGQVCVDKLVDGVAHFAPHRVIQTVLPADPQPRRS